MKFQLVLFALLVVAALADRHDGNKDERRLGSKHNKERHRNDNQIAANAEETQVEESESSSESVEEQNKKTEGRRGGRHGHHGNHGRHGGCRGDRHRHGQGHEQDNDNNKQHDHFTHNADWHQKNGVPMPDDNAEEGRHRHHHHHHRHHRNHTTTVPTTTSTEPSFDLNDNDIRSGNDNGDDHTELVDHDP